MTSFLMSIYAFLGSFITTFIMLKLFFKLSFKIGLLDYPGGRKKHKQPIPLIGGIAIFVGFNATVFSLFYHKIIQNYGWLYCIASILLLWVSILDDKKNLSVKTRMFVHVFVAFLIACAINPQLFSSGNIALAVYQIPFPLVIFTIVGIMNAFNMMDGLDGLVGSIALVSSLVLLYLAIQGGAVFEILCLISLIGSLIAFLLFNFPASFNEKQKIFLGDVGSMFLGFTLSWLCMRLTQGENGYSPFLMLWVLALPIMDTLHLIINRKARGNSPFRSDRRHIHHMLLHLKYSNCQTVLILMSVSLVCSTLGIVLYYFYHSGLVLTVCYLLLFSLYSLGSYALKKKVAVKTTLSINEVKPAVSWIKFIQNINRLKMNKTRTLENIME